MLNRLKMNLQFFAEEPEGGNEPPTTVKIGDKEYSIEDLQNKLTGYEKLEKQFTKVSQENSELRKTGEAAKKWLDFDAYVAQFPENVQQQFIQQVNSFFSNVQTGDVQQKDITGINKAIKTAEKAGDNKTADTLRDARDEALSELLFEKEMLSIEKQAKKDGIEFDEDHFRGFLKDYLEEEGLSEDDEFDTKKIKEAYRAYKLDIREKRLSEKEKSDEKSILPNVGTGGSGIGVGANKQSKAPKNLKEAAKMARDYFK